MVKEAFHQKGWYYPNLCANYGRRHLRADVSTKHSVLQSYWSYDTGRVKTKVNGAKSINDDLMEVYQDITQSKKELLEEGRILNAQSVKLRYLGQDLPLRTLRDLLQYHKDNEVQKLVAGTAKNYGATEKYLLLFIKKKYNLIRMIWLCAKSSYSIVAGGGTSEVGYQLAEYQFFDGMDKEVIKKSLDSISRESLDEDENKVFYFYLRAYEDGFIEKRYYDIETLEVMERI